MSASTHTLPIAIIGAGLSCAQALLQAGHTVHVFDKSSGPSARMSTRRAENAANPWQCDNGAQYCTERDPQFRAEVARWQQAGVAARWAARHAAGALCGHPAHDSARWLARAKPVAGRRPGAGAVANPRAKVGAPCRWLGH